MNEDHAGENFIWGMTLVRRNTRSSIAVALPTSLNSELNFVTIADLPTEKTFEAINEWAEIEFQGWETVALLPRFDKASK